MDKRAKKVLKVFGGVLREARREQGVTQEQLAAECGLDRMFV